MHKLREILHPNRWFIWTLVLAFAVFIVVYGAVQKYSIEQEYSAQEDELSYSIRLTKKATINNGISAPTIPTSIEIGDPPIVYKLEALPNIDASLKKEVIFDEKIKNYVEYKTFTFLGAYYTQVSVKENDSLSLRDWGFKNKYFGNGCAPESECWFTFEDGPVFINGLKWERFTYQELGETIYFLFDDKLHKRIILAETSLSGQPSSMSYEEYENGAVDFMKEVLAKIQI